MQNEYQAPRLGASLLACAELRQLLDAARMEDTIFARRIELAVLIPCSATQLAWAPVERIDRASAMFHVLTDDGEWCPIVAGRFGMEAIDAACGGRTRGPLIIDYDGPIEMDRTTVDPVTTVFGNRDAGLDGPYGLFNLIRTSVLAHFSWAGVPAHVAAAQSGEPDAVRGAGGGIEQLVRQAVAAQAWHGMLGLWTRPGKPSDFHVSRNTRQFGAAPSGTGHAGRDVKR